MKTIRVSVPSLGDREMLSRFGWARDEFYGALLRDTVATLVSDMNKTVTQFDVQVHRTRDLGTVTTLLRKILKRHELAEFAIIEHLDAIAIRAHTDGTRQTGEKQPVFMIDPGAVRLAGTDARVVNG